MLGYFSKRPLVFQEWLIFRVKTHESRVCLVIHYRNQSKPKILLYCEVWPLLLEKNLNDQESMCFYSDMFYDIAVKSCLK